MDMTGQPMLWTPAVEALHLQAHWAFPEGWQLHVNWRRSGCTWDHEPAQIYPELSTPELQQVASDVLIGLLGL